MDSPCWYIHDCFGCHGGDKRSGGLTLRNYNDVLKGGETVHPSMRLRIPSKTAVAGTD